MIGCNRMKWLRTSRVTQTSKTASEAITVNFKLLIRMSRPIVACGMILLLSTFSKASDKSKEDPVCPGTQGTTVYDLTPASTKSVVA